MRVLHVSSEVAPFAQSGGLADVVAGLPAAQAGILGVQAAVLVPLYRGVAAKLAAAGCPLETPVPLPLSLGPYAFDCALRVAKVGPVRYGFVDIPALYDRPGNLYGPSGAAEFPDNHLRFAALGKVAQLAGAILLGGVPDVLHVHDWQGAPAAIYAHVAKAPSAIVCTIHNLAYRGIFGKGVMTDLGLPWSLFTPKRLEFWDQVSFLKAGLALADVVTTVSPSYAQEILTPERGEALDGFLRDDVERLVGIVNGIDTLAWDPTRDGALPATFSRDHLEGKARCRAALVAEAGLPEIGDDEPLIGVIARMTDQKGLDLVADIAPELGTIGARLVVLGAGEHHLEQRFRYLAEVFSHHVSARIGFDLGYARRIYAGSDLFVMPSRFEPCGLGQLYAMRYGAIPIVSAVGGLRDTVDDPGDAALAQGHGTGIKMREVSATALLQAIERGARLYRTRAAFRALQRAAMARDSSWLHSANEYVQLYRSLRR